MEDLGGRVDLGQSQGNKVYDYHSGLPTLLEKNYSIDRASLLDEISGYPYGLEVIVKERYDYISDELINTLSS